MGYSHRNRSWGEDMGIIRVLRPYLAARCRPRRDRIGLKSELVLLIAQVALIHISKILPRTKSRKA